MKQKSEALFLRGPNNPMFSLTRESKHIKAKEGNPLRLSINQSTAPLVYTNDAL